MMSAMDVAEPRVTRQSTSELARQASAFQEETAGVAGNAETLSVALAAASFASGMAISAGGPTIFGAGSVAADATGQVNADGGSSDGNSSEEEEETEVHDTAEWARYIIHQGMRAGYTVRFKAAQLFAENENYLYDNGYKSIVDCANVADESVRSNTIYKKDVQAAMDSGKETPPASQEDLFAESQESDLVDEDKDTDFTLEKVAGLSSAQLLKMSAVHKVLAVRLKETLEQDPFQSVVRSFAKVRRAMPCPCHAHAHAPCHTHPFPSHSISFHPLTTATQERSEQGGGDGFGYQVATAAGGSGVDDVDGAQLRG